MTLDEALVVLRKLRGLTPEETEAISYAVAALEALRTVGLDSATT